MKIKRRNHRQNSQCQEELRTIDAWLERLHRGYPVLHWLLAIGIAVGVFALAMFLKWLLTGFPVSERKARPSIREREVTMSKDAFKQSGSSPTDLIFENCGSLFLIRPVSQAGQLWLDENVGDENTLTFGGAVVCEPRYVEAIYFGAKHAGLAVQT